MAHSDFRVLGECHRVHFAGFQADTWELQQQGWQLAVAEDFRRDSIRLALSHPPSGLYMVGEAQPYHFRDVSFGYRGTQKDPLDFVVRHCSSKISVILHESQFNFRPIDAMPVVTEAPIKRIEDFSIFAPSLVRTEEIIIEPQSVAECMELIRKMQAPELAAVRERNRQRDFMEAGTPQKFHAQIMSLAA